MKLRMPDAKVRSRILDIIVFLFILLVAALFLFPTVLTIANSFMTSNEISSNYGAMFSNMTEDKKTFISTNVNLKFIPDKVTFAQYKAVLIQNSDYLMKFWNSVILTVPITLFQMIVAILTSYGFSRYPNKFKSIIFFTYIILMIMPYQVTLVPNFLVADKFGMLDTRSAIILPAIFSPFSIFLLTKVMRRIPVSYVEAAKLDGASELKILTKIYVPLCKGAIVSIAMLVFIDYWNMVEQPIVLMKENTLHPLSVFLSQINTGDIGLAFAVGTVYMIPTVLMFLYGEDYLVEGITYSGGIKG
ncbi:carbohydrate ABC transporter permease [Ruminococcus flavefaciens]|uniref:carbohydrate ABC transporter permease n=1 Tax=Ruminococcus flavefaciens TaxID=1265 RepID=UPI0026EC1640|nr:carbohydrate ABC transporter permease [Ruminococcus flavefaciens]MDD7518047.1 carbohydrate ABC transporter permease [Ruminococcus flavefaciens]MDY5692951.1 carbohydrate ABC transporter permease [Ruminococcus flavefaciens]